MQHPDFDKANSHITAERLRQILCEMVDIPSPTGGELEMATYMAERMRSAGLEIELQEVDHDRPNAVGHLRGLGTGTNLLFTGHMDTSYSGDEEHLSGIGFKPKAEYRDGWVWGLGANNMKSGLAAAMVAVEAIAKAGTKLQGDISIGAVVGEIEKAPIEEFQGLEYSGYGAGSKHLVTHGVTADFAILVEPTGLRISPANMGCIWARITVGGTVAHSALANKPGIVNAITLMQELETELMAWTKQYELRNEYLGEHPNVTLAAIRGGAPWRLSRNPYECRLYLDIRTIPGQSTEALKRELRALLRQFAERTGTPEPALTFYITDPPNLIDEGLPVVQALGEAQSGVAGERAPSIIRRPGADAVHFTAYGVPCVVFGPGGRLHPDAKGGGMHAVGEHVAIEDVVTASRIYLATALDLCSREPTA
jgi:acetylornithine deacetylase/succinyl-diaminopimelate desuccinylase-like protein